MSVYRVTGGAGFIGSHVVEALVRRGERVQVLDNLSTGRRENLVAAGGQVELIEGDIRDRDVLGWAIGGVDYVLHLAAMVSVQQSMADPGAAHETNVTGTLNVLMAAREAHVQRVVLASSCAVYGDNQDLPLRETARPHPLSPYAASKLAGELYCQLFTTAFDVPTVALRYFNVYGPRQNPRGDYAAVIPRFVERMKAGQRPVIYGDGTQTRDFVYVGDVVRANLIACERTEAVGQVFNIASGQRTSLIQLASLVNQVLGAQLAPEFEPDRPGDIRHSSGDGGRIAALLGFRPETALAEGLRQLITCS